MLTVSLLRHAKSSWDDANLDDFDRPLAGRGRHDAPRMATAMGLHGIDPDLVVCSSAKRTRQTLELIEGVFSPRVEITIESELYLAEPQTMIARLRRVADARAHTLIVGHNPGLQALALDLIGAGERREINAIATKFPTCGLAVIDIEIGRWRDFRTGDGQLRLFMSPKRLPMARGVAG